MSTETNAAASGTPRLILVAGPPGSGRQSWIRKNAAKLPGHVVGTAGKGEWAGEQARVAALARQSGYGDIRQWGHDTLAEELGRALRAGRSVTLRTMLARDPAASKAASEAARAGYRVECVFMSTAGPAEVMWQGPDKPYTPTDRGALWFMTRQALAEHAGQLAQVSVVRARRGTGAETAFRWRPNGPVDKLTPLEEEEQRLLAMLVQTTTAEDTKGPCPPRLRPLMRYLQETLHDALDRVEGRALIDPERKRTHLLESTGEAPRKTLVRHYRSEPGAEPETSAYGSGDAARLQRDVWAHATTGAPGGYKEGKRNQPSRAVLFGLATVDHDWHLRVDREEHGSLIAKTAQVGTGVLYAGESTPVDVGEQQSVLIRLLAAAAPPGI